MTFNSWAVSLDPTFCNSLSFLLLGVLQMKPWLWFVSEGLFEAAESIQQLCSKQWHKVPATLPRLPRIVSGLSENRLGWGGKWSSFSPSSLAAEWKQALYLEVSREGNAA